MALKFIEKVNSKSNFLNKKNRFVSPELPRMLCNAVIQPSFDYTCLAWYPNLTENKKTTATKNSANYAKYMHKILPKF